MVTVMITIEVSDFLEWKKIFDANEPIRQQINIKQKMILISIENPDRITMILEAKNKDHFHHFFYNDHLVKKAIEKYGFLFPPLVEYYNKLQ